MKKRTIKILSLVLCAVMLLGTLSGCGGGGEDSAGSTSFTWELDTTDDAQWYTEYEDNPAVQYWLSHEWDADGDGKGKKVTIDYITLPSGAEQDTMNTWLGTGEYPDIMSTTYCSQKAPQLYEEGVILDVTEYVEKYMPHYLQWAEEHPDYASRLTTNVNGERRYLGVYTLSDTVERPWGGFLYRRDWIVKYGTNPETGAAFTGAWDENGNWVDDVVFPSGGTDPIYISDWEWMLGIFDKALKEQNITDGYAMQLSYTGYWATGEIVSGFGDPPINYIGEDGKAHAGYESENFRAYLECVSKWYANGWIDKQFDERANDMFFMIDMGSVYAGKVGLWYGMVGSLGSSMDTSGGDTSNPTNGIVVAGAPQPINDVYGSDACKNIKPFAYYGDSLMFGPTVFTKKCEGKDLATLFTALDYLFDKETGARLKSLGLTKEQVEEIDCQWYRDAGLEDGAYTVVTDENGETRFVVNPVASSNQDGLESACKINKSLGLGMYGGRVYDEPACISHWISLWCMYNDFGCIGTEVSDQFTPEQQEKANMIFNNVLTYMARTVPRFVKGELDPTNDANWDEYCKGIQELSPYEYNDFVDQVLGN